MAESLLLKWGTVKGWSGLKPESVAILQRWSDLGATVSAMAQRDTPEQKAIICEFIDTIDGEIANDWSGEIMTKEAAKEYVMTYGQRK